MTREEHFNLYLVTNHQYSSFTWFVNELRNSLIYLEKLEQDRASKEWINDQVIWIDVIRREIESRK